jgi:hypothetical protein
MELCNNPDDCVHGLRVWDLEDIAQDRCPGPMVNRDRLISNDIPQLKPHCHPTFETKALLGLVVLDRSEPGPDFVVVEDPEPEMLVQGSVPRYI